MAARAAEAAGRRRTSSSLIAVRGHLLDLPVLLGGGRLRAPARRERRQMMRSHCSRPTAAAFAQTRLGGRGLGDELDDLVVHILLLLLGCSFFALTAADTS